MASNTILKFLSCEAFAFSVHIKKLEIYKIFPAKSSNSMMITLRKGLWNILKNRNVAKPKQDGKLKYTRSITEKVLPIKAQYSH